MKTKNIRIGFLPWWPQNPYQILLKNELNKLGYTVIGNPRLSMIKTILNRDGLDIVHIHWPHALYHKKLWKLPHAVLSLLLYRFMKNNIIWTVHELDFYETKLKFLDRFIIKLLFSISKGLIVHSLHSKELIQSRFKYKNEITVTYHPPYTDYYKSDISIEEARYQLAIPSEIEKVFVFFGYIKPYKGVENLITQFKKIAHKNIRLIIAGNPLNNEIKTIVESLASDDDRIITDLRYIADDEIQVYMNAANVAVFPFKYTHTSGSIMLALSYGLPVIAPNIASIPEYIDTACSIMFDPNDDNSLYHSLLESTNCNLATMKQHAKNNAARFSWEEMARNHASLYNSIHG